MGGALGRCTQILRKKRYVSFCDFLLPGLTLPFSSSYSPFYTMQLVCKTMSFATTCALLVLYISCL